MSRRLSFLAPIIAMLAGDPYASQRNVPNYLRGYGAARENPKTRRRKMRRAAFEHFGKIKARRDVMAAGKPNKKAPDYKRTQAERLAGIDERQPHPQIWPRGKRYGGAGRPA